MSYAELHTSHPASDIKHLPQCSNDCALACHHAATIGAPNGQVEQPAAGCVPSVVGKATGYVLGYGLQQELDNG